jgi:hypothetical protein
MALIGVGMLIVLVLLTVVAIFAITKSTEGLTSAENEQLAARTKNIALMLDKVIEEEKKMGNSLSIDPDIIAAAKAVSMKQDWAALARRRREARDVCRHQGPGGKLPDDRLPGA